LRLSILTFARENKEVKLMEWIYFIDKFSCPLETVGNGHPPPPPDEASFENRPLPSDQNYEQ